MADPKKTSQQLISDYDKLNESISEQIKNLNAVNDVEKINIYNAELRAERQRVINQLINDLINLEDEEKQKLNDLIDLQQKEIDNEKKVNKQLETQKKLRGDINSLAKGLWQYLNQNDKIIRNTILNLGLSGTKAEMMRTSFEQSAGQVARLGGTLEDVQNIMQGYADETGRARVLSADMVKDVTLIGKGTGLGVEQATRLAGVFENMGMNTKTTMEYVQGVVDTSERMGVNSNKILKSLSDNFKKLQTYTFQGGVKSMARMVQYSEKFKVDMNAALNAADISRTLEGAIDLAANLQVMGGEFAKTDPFEMLFLSRNDPEKFTEKISEMTRGMVTFRKNSEGVFEKFISPADRDRLASVAKSLGMSVEQMTEMTLKRAEMDKMAQQMTGMGISKADKELIQGAATFNSKTGKFEAMVAGQMRDVTTLTTAQAQSFVKERKSLEERAKQAQTFDEAFKNTINELKAALLPMLKGVDAVLKAVRPFAEKLGNAVAWLAGSGIGQTLLKWVGGGMAVGFLLIKAFGLGKTLISGLSGVAGKIAGAFSRSSGEGGGAIGSEAGGGSGGKGGFGKSLGKGLGVGTAAVGIGAGVAVAAVGISKLADSMSKLSPEQAKALQSIAMTLAITFPLAAIGIAAVGATATIASGGLLALGATMLMIGGAVFLAATGIGNMADGLGNLVKNAKGAGKDMINVGVGIAAIAASMGLFTVGALGFVVFAATMNKIAKTAPAMKEVGLAFTAMSNVGDSFDKINTAVTTLRGSKDDLEEISAVLADINRLSVSKSGFFSEFANLLKNPLKVEFASKGIQVVDNITLNIDGQKFMEKVYKTDLARTKDNEVAKGQTNGRG
jgi:hypothetical protein